MILIDDREEGADKKRRNLDILQHVQRQKIEVHETRLDFADAAIEVNGPNGILMVGVERKRLHDMLNCVEDARYNQQRIGMKGMYDYSVLIVEGHWKPHDPEGILMDGYKDGLAFGYARPRGQRVMYAKIYRYLLSVAFSGVMIQQTRDPFHTAYNLCEIHGWGQKNWNDHTAMREIYTAPIPTLGRKPSLTRKWGQALDMIGVKKGELVERHFRSPLALAKADENEWLKIPGVGIKTAQDIVREIWGKR